MTTVGRLALAMALSALCVAPGSNSEVRASETPIPVAVVDFTASTQTPYRLGLPEFIVDELVNSERFDVLERDKLRTVVGEVAFQTSAGLVRPDSAVQVGRMLGARLLVTGHVIDHGRETREFSGYGISASTTTWRLKARIEVIDVTTGSKGVSEIPCLGCLGGVCSVRWDVRHCSSSGRIAPSWPTAIPPERGHGAISTGCPRARGP